jgi:hypothetical protein
MQVYYFPLISSLYKFVINGMMNTEGLAEGKPHMFEKIIFKSVYVSKHVGLINIFTNLLYEIIPPILYLPY